MKTREEFEEYINSKIDKKDITKYDKYSKAIKTLIILGMCALAVGWIGLLVFLIVASNTFGRVFNIAPIMGTMIFVAIGLFIAAGVVSSYRRKLIGKYMIDLIEYTLSDRPHTYTPNAFIAKDIFTKSQFSSGIIDRYYGEDLLTIPLTDNNNNLTLCDLRICDITAIEYYTDNEGNHKERTLYSGMFGYIEFPNPFKCVLDINTGFGCSLKTEKVLLEDIQFNKSFKIKSSDQVEARYILSVDTMQYLQSLKQKMGSIKMVLTGNTMYIGFPYHNLFNTKKKGQKGLIGNFYSMYEDVNTLIEFVTTIQNNDKVFTTTSN